MVSVSSTQLSIRTNPLSDGPMEFSKVIAVFLLEMLYHFHIH